MPNRDKFGYFDPTQEFSVTCGRLPHWEQPGATCFITFRTADSLPASVLELWTRRRDDWLRRRDVEPTEPDWQRQFQTLPLQTQFDFHREFSADLERSLDTGYGACHLRNPAIAEIVRSALLHFDQDRYWLGDFVIMPNHVHLLVCFTRGVSLRMQCHSWKHFTSVEINRILGTRGQFWQQESFDHLVRSPEHFDRFRRYILENPMKAGLKAGEFVHCRSPHVEQSTM